MEIAHLHLLFNHLPLFGSAIGVLMLIQGLFTKSESSCRSAFILFFFCAIGAGLAYATGEPAAEKLTESYNYHSLVLDQHKIVARISLAAMILLGAGSVAGYILSWKKSHFAKNASYIILALGLAGFGLVLRTGYLGGEIRKPVKKIISYPPAPRADSIKQPAKPPGGDKPTSSPVKDKL